MSTGTHAARAAILTLLPALLAGCPYIWEPPQLSGDSDDPADPLPPGPDTDDTDTDDTDTDDTDDTDTDDTDTDPGDTGDTDPPPVGDPPVISNVTATYRYEVVVLGFHLEDVDGDLSGGTLWLSEDGGAPTAYAVPGDLTTWDGSDGTIELQVGAPCAGIDRAYDLKPEDAAGHLGNALGKRVEVGGHTVVEQVAVYPLGAIDLPAVICGNLSNGNDVDETSFTPNAGGTWTFSLTWPGNTDRDAELLDANDAVVASATSQSKPDTMQANLTAGAPYVLRVWSPAAGPGGNWLLVIHE